MKLSQSDKLLQHAHIDKIKSLGKFLYVQNAAKTNHLGAGKQTNCTMNQHMTD